MKIVDLLEQHAATSLEKQWALSDLFGDHNWNLDLEQGVLTITGVQGTQLFAVQVLGTESEYDSTWLWGWANIDSGIPLSLLRCANELRELGREQGIAEFTEPEIGLMVVDGTQLSLIASGICEAFGYYRGPYEGGAVFLILDAPTAHLQVETSAVRVINVFTQLISAVPVNHKRAFLAYMHDKGYRCQSTDTGDVEVYSAADPVLCATFDAQDRLTKIEATVIP